ncbi:hypothetical protein CNR22_09745 [Sphingobacteriaceae bacterium]|nr:hypothetical protein CNR22_09745 [Sphingobacteriaceae bacterium]
MKTNFLLGSLLSLTLASPLKADVAPAQFPCSSLDTNLIINGDFDFPTGYTSGFTYMGGSSLGLYGNGSTINTFNINPITTAYSLTDHNGGNGNVMHFPDIQGANVGQVFWKQTGITVTPGNVYKLSIWVREPSGNCGFQAGGTIFDIYINGMPVQVSDNTVDCLGWHNKIYTWSSGPSTLAQIEIRNGSGNGNVNLAGMDLLLDDISLRKCIPPTPCENLLGELIGDGDFDSTTVITSSYASYSGCAPGGIQGDGTTGNYNINAITTCYGVTDRFSANGNVLHFPDIDGSKVGWDFWKQTVLSITPNTTYVLVFWVYEPNGNCAVQPSGTNFDVYINGSMVSDVVGTCGVWKKKTYVWNSGPSTSATIRIATGIYGNYNDGTYGMDLMLDGISFKECKKYKREAETVGIETLKTNTNSQLIIMPNPSNGNTTLKSLVNMELKITNELGQVIKTISLNETNNFTQPLIDLSEGIYFINSYSEGNFIKRKLIITNK